VDVDRDQVERGVSALLPFVQAWHLSLNPEDLDEMVYAVLLHAPSNRTFEEIDEAVRTQLAEYRAQMDAMHEAHRRATEDPPAPE
jgi:hypothetical protein